MWKPTMDGCKTRGAVTCLGDFNRGGAKRQRHAQPSRGSSSEVAPFGVVEDPSLTSWRTNPWLSFAPTDPPPKYKFQFTPEQIENLKLWKNSLSSEKARDWALEEDKAEIETSNILNDKKFVEGEDLSGDKLDELFVQMKWFSANRNLSNLLYRNNGLPEFNRP